MKKNNRISAVLILTVFVCSLVFGSNAQAITIKEELELSKEFLNMVASRFQIIDDPVIDDYVNKIGRRILVQFPPQPFEYKFYVIKEETFNAFASPGGHIFINSGLIEALDGEEELAGIIGHEISHVVCRHISQRIERSKKINLATMAGMIAGIFLGVGGSAAAGNAVAIGTMAGSQSLSLSYSREDERQADEIGLQYLSKTGYDGKGLLTSLEKIRSKQWFSSDQVPNYLLTHPASEERMAYISGWLERHNKENKSAALKKSPADPAEFRRVHTRLVAKYSEPQVAQVRFKSMIAKNPEDAMAHYGYGILLSRMGDQIKATTHLKKALELSALDPYFLMELGRVYFSEGHYENAVSTLSSATDMVDDSNGKFYLGRAQMALGKLDEAVAIFEEIIKKDKNYFDVYYYLGEAYGKLENLGEAHFYLGLFYYNKRDLKNTRFHLSRALKSIKDKDKQREARKILDHLPRRPPVQPD